MSIEISTRVDTLALLRELESAGAATPSGLVLSKEISYQDYERLARLFGMHRRACAFWIGDLLAYAEIVYGETYAQAVDLFGLPVETLRNYKWVCEAIPRDRRRDDLSFTHHRLVAGLAPQEQVRWLARASQGRWSREELRRQLKEANALPARPEQPRWSKTLPEVRVVVKKQDGSTVEFPAVVEQGRDSRLLALVSGGEVTNAVDEVFAPSSSEQTDHGLSSSSPSETSEPLVDAVVRMLSEAERHTLPDWLVEWFAELAAVVNYEAKEEEE